ncbi:unnamed protein product [Strongylus vulgaris]|uniref:Uncharacterized protein n=1 Tax=Strongylus vulgaris TaxID=40348 RepID=A0A3P7JFR0_STRVU|nr:unnamed protein product [Strongylus vulgaris]
MHLIGLLITELIIAETIRNVTGQLAGQVGNTAAGVVNTIGDVAQGVRAGVFGQNLPSESGYQSGNSNGYNSQMQRPHLPNQNPDLLSPGAFAPASAVSGVMTMNGVNGQSGNNAYNMNPESIGVGVRIFIIFLFFYLFKLRVDK